MKQTIKGSYFGVLLILPAFALLCLVYIYPLVYNIDLSFSQWDLVAAEKTEKHYIGLANYQQHLFDPLFYRVLWNTIFFTSVSVPLEFFAGLALALLLNRISKGKSLLAAILLLPMMIAPVVVGLAWKWLYAWDYGILNPLLGLFGIGPIAWLADPSIAMYSVIIADAWCTIPFILLFAYAGIQMIPVELYEAAKIDGASGWQMLRYIVFPSIKGILFIALMLRTMDAFTKLFDVVYILTGGGPGYSTEVLPLYTYRMSFQFFRLGRGAALGVLTFFFAALIILLLMKMWRK